MSSGGLTYGADPEFPIVDKDGFVSAIRILKGHGKSNKLPISDGQFAFYDNVLMEFNVAPAFTFRDFSQNFVKCLVFTKELLKKNNCKIIQQSSMKFPKEECNDEEAFQLGCEPEFCIYKKNSTGQVLMVDPPEIFPGNTFRSCGGHIHIGHPIATLEKGNPIRVVKLMDIFVGATSLLLNHDDTSDARRKLYGGAGTHRLADYGLEYRTLSNFWFASPRIANIVYRLTRLAVQLAVAAPAMSDNLIKDSELKEVINKGNKQEAQRLFETIREYMSDDLQENIRLWQQNPPIDMETEWGLVQDAKKAKAI